MNPQIFKAYDIRGRYPSQLDDSAAWAIGYGLAQFLDDHQGGVVLVGRDMRSGGQALAEQAMRGLRQAGREVIDLGEITTPMLYFAVNQHHAAGGIMVTASHNPAGYNGFKLVREQAIPIAEGSGLEQVQRLAECAPKPRPQTRAARRLSVREDYTRYFLQRFQPGFPRRVLIDAGNGMAGSILPEILDRLSIDYEGLFFEPDGRFPNHEANPLVDENLTDLQQAMRNQPGAIGIAFDGDGDRVAFLDEAGRRVRGDVLTGLLAEWLLEREGPGPVLYDLRSSHLVPHAIAAHGGTPIRVRVGHSFIKAAMRKHQALCGGELSYHFYFRDFFHCESGILAMLLVLELLQARQLTLEEAAAPYRTRAHSGEINYEVAAPLATIDAVAEAFPEAAKDRLDGLTIEHAHWWFNLRASNTEPLLRLNLEAEQEDVMHEKLALLSELITGNASAARGAG